jgi:hypothetical protein
MGEQGRQSRTGTQSCRATEAGMQGRAKHAVKGKRACKKAHMQMKTGTTREAEEGTPVAKARYVGQGRQWTAQSKQAEQSTQGRHAGRGTAMQARRTSQRNVGRRSGRATEAKAQTRQRRQFGVRQGRAKQAAFPLHECTSMLGYTYIACLAVLYLNYW